MASLEKRHLGSTQVQVTSLGVGTSPLGGCGVEASFEQFDDVITTAFKNGIRYFDTAPLYGLGKSEHSLGHILRVHGLRSQVVVSTKVGRRLKPASKGVRAPSTYAINWIDPLPYVDEYTYTYDGIMRSFEDSQQRMGLDRIDILFVHDIGRAWFGDQYETYLQQLRDGGFRALDQLRSEGSVGAIGLGVNETQAVLDISEEFNLDCSMVAGRYSLLNADPARAFFPECQRRNISIIAAGVFNSGVLAQGSKGVAAQRTYDCQPVPAEILKRVEALEEVCARHGVPLATAALHFAYNHPAVSAVVVGALEGSQIAQTATSISQAVPTALWADLRSAGLIPQDAQLA